MADGIESAIGQAEAVAGDKHVAVIGGGIMRLGLHIVEFEDHGKPIRSMIKEIVQYADANGFSSVSVMDHFFQIPHIHEMRPLEMLAQEVIPAIAEF